MVDNVALRCYNVHTLIERARNMATRSTIAVKHTDGSISQIYCHWDGGPDHNGRILNESYTTLERAEQLVALGDLSVLGSDIEPAEGLTHTFDNSIRDVCVAYRRDRGETGVGARRFASDVEFRMDGDNQEFNYLFVDGQWKVTKG